MTIITEKICGRLKINHLIENDGPENPRTYASYIQLVNYYKELDNNNNDNWHYYFIVRRHFLRRKKRENGGNYWNCHYCGKPVYKMQERNTNKQDTDCITVDHIIAKANGGDILNTKNMIESCSKCNTKKGTKDYNVFIKEIH